MKYFAPGAYPTMITPYNSDNTVDSGAVRALTDWYFEKGCSGIFASCQSSEIHCLTLEERILVAQLTKEEADRLHAAHPDRPPMTIVASGHVSDAFEDQVTELNEIASLGVDALILISNRFDIENTGDDAWIRDFDRLLQKIDPEIPLGIYECPRPYKRLLTPAILRHCVETGRFAFIKDTCCDYEEIDRRMRLIDSAPLPEGGIRTMLFNANAQTLLHSLRSGASGYCGVMCNFHPELYAWLCENYASDPEKAEKLQAFLCSAAFIESLTYPCIAKYHLNRTGVTMNADARTNDVRKMGAYDRMCVEYMDSLAAFMKKELSL